jgi:hypothetical protein
MSDHPIQVVEQFSADGVASSFRTSIGIMAPPRIRSVMPSITLAGWL